MRTWRAAWALRSHRSGWTCCPLRSSRALRTRGTHWSLRARRASFAGALAWRAWWSRWSLRPLRPRRPLRSCWTDCALRTHCTVLAGRTGRPVPGAGCGRQTNSKGASQSKVPVHSEPVSVSSSGKCSAEVNCLTCGRYSGNTLAGASIALALPLIAAATTVGYRRRRPPYGKISGAAASKRAS